MPDDIVDLYAQLARLQNTLAAALTEREFRTKSIDLLNKMLEIREDNREFLKRTTNAITLPEYYMLRAEIKVCENTIKSYRVAIGQLNYMIRERRRQVAQMKQSIKQAEREARKQRMKDVNAQ